MQADHVLSEEITSGHFYRNPYPFFAEFREKEPVFYSEALGGWVLLRYEEVDQILRDHEIFSSKGRVLHLLEKLPVETKPKIKLLSSHFSYGLAHSDNPEHKRLRSLLAQAFTPKFVESFKPTIIEIVESTISKLDSEFDLIEDLFVPIPALVIGKLLGSQESDIQNLIKWAGAINGLYEKGGNIAEEKALYAETMLQEIRLFVLELVNYRRQLQKSGKLNPNSDVLSGLVAAENEFGSLSEDELVSTVVTLFVAGHETTTHLLGNGFFALFNSGISLNEFHDNNEKIADLVDEMARFDGSVPRSWRINKSEVTLNYHSIPAGSLILPMLASANHDPKVFDNPDIFRINGDSRKHLAFGKGIHVCLGAPLARIEGQEILKSILKFKPNLEFNCNLENLDWRKDIALRGLIELPVKA